MSAKEFNRKYKTIDELSEAATKRSGIKSLTTWGETLKFAQALNLVTMEEMFEEVLFYLGRHQYSDARERCSHALKLLIKIEEGFQEGGTNF